MSNNFTISYASQLACRNPNTTIPGPPILANSSVASCAITKFLPSTETLLSTCCNTSTGNIVKENSQGVYAPTNLFEQVPTAGYSVDGCDWRYCNVTGQSGIDTFEKCLNTTTINAGMNVKGKCFMGEKAPADASSDGNKIKWRSDKKKQTVSAALLIALGVAGIIMGS